jgi:endoglucanase
MLRLIVPLLCLFLFSHAAAAAETCTYNPASVPKTVALKRGINLPVWWETRRWNPDEEELSVLYRTGFDFVRLPIHPKWLEEEDKEEQAETLQNLRCDIISLLNAGFTVIVDMHPGGTTNDAFAAMSDRQVLSRLTALWRNLGEALRELPAQRLWLNLYNEPSLPTVRWWKLQGKLITALRRVFPRHGFIASENPMDEGLTARKPYGDPNVLYDFHFYAPMLFTHNGAEWSDTYRAPQESVPYPARANMVTDDMNEEMQTYLREGWNRKKLSGLLEPLRAWKKRYGTRLVCLEFGVYRFHIDDQSRTRWLRDTRTLLEEAGIPWALWEYNQGFGLFEGGKPDLHMAKALGLRYGEKP